ncbi:hypothetical protein ACN38_g10512 [Penicillium nordicum]|uniref:Uncharacterized protein n=1 Tax=Penicillium nordicum TaxID=229535 RepID=A0A0M8NTV3_9EURO|nr:hypothetical protein ACN38_g10512 [Penicillium nordicum]
MPMETESESSWLKFYLSEPYQYRKLGDERTRSAEIWWICMWYLHRISHDINQYQTAHIKVHIILWQHVLQN